LTEGLILVNLVNLRTMLLGVGGSIYSFNTLHPLKELGLDPQALISFSSLRRSASLVHCEQVP